MGSKPGSLFVIAGDQNSDPLDGDSIPGSIQLLLEHPLVNTKLTPESPGAVQQNALQGGANLTHRSDPRFDTADFARHGARRTCGPDYVLPRKNMQIVDGAVFWPLTTDPLFRLVGHVPVPDLGPPARLGRHGAAVELGQPTYAATAARSSPASWQSRQRASYCSFAPTTIVAPEYGAGRPSTSRCVVVAGPPQRWQTACSLSTNSAWASSSGIGPNGSRRKSWSRPGGDHARAAVGERERRPDDLAVEELNLVDPDDLHAACALDELGDVRHRDGPHADARVADDVGRRRSGRRSAA